MTVIRTTCKTCGDVTIFTDSVPDNDHIILVSGTPNSNAVYRCVSCNSDMSQDTGEIETLFVEENIS